MMACSKAKVFDYLFYEKKKKKDLSIGPSYFYSLLFTICHLILIINIFEILLMLNKQSNWMFFTVCFSSTLILYVSLSYKLLIYYSMIIYTLCIQSGLLFLKNILILLLFFLKIFCVLLDINIVY
jgi:hypothetical protein